MMLRRRLAMASLVLSSLLMLPAWCHARTWSDVSGRFQIEAELVKVSADGGTVTLRRSDGKTLDLKLDQLSEADRDFVRTLRAAGSTRGEPANPFLMPGDRGVSVEPVAKVNHRRALLIGVNEYKNFRKLKYCGADVRALGKRLASAGFDADKVVVIHDEATRSLQPDKEKITGQIALMFEAAEPNDLVLLVFSGHGVRINGKSYFVPFEGEAPKSDQASDIDASTKTLISVDWVYEKLQSCRASMKLFLVDACQNRLFEGDQRSVGPNVSVGEISQSLDEAPKGVLLLTACAAGEFSHEAESFQHGVYTHYLLEALDGKADYNHDGIISLKEANLYASTHTEQFVRNTFSKTQRPSFRGELQGDVPLAQCLEMDRITVPDDIDKLDIALKRAAPGATITVKPGIYRYAAALEVTREVTIVSSTGDPKDVVLESSEGSAVVFMSERARLQAVSLRTSSQSPTIHVSEGSPQIVKCDVTCPESVAILVAGEKSNPSVSYCNVHGPNKGGISLADKAGGRFEQCEISGSTLAGVEIHSGANPTFSDCKIHDGQAEGVIVWESGRGTFENCDIWAVAVAGVSVGGGSQPTFRRCKIRDSQKDGIWVREKSAGSFENCEISGSTAVGVAVEGEATTAFVDCRIHDSKDAGIYVYDQGAASFERCEIWGNNASGAQVAKGGNPTMKDCRFHDGKERGVVVFDEGRGTFENCDISGNPQADVQIDSGGQPTFKGCNLHDSKEGGILVQDRGLGSFENCEISGCGAAGVDITKDGNATFNACKIHGGKAGGIYAHERGFGTFDNCDLWENGLAAISVESDSNPTVRDCRIYDGKDSGIYVYKKGFGAFERCEIFRNQSDGVAVDEGSNPVLKDCKIHDQKRDGISSSSDSFGTFEGCEIWGNQVVGVRVFKGANPTLKDCTIRDGNDAGVIAEDGGFGTFEACVISGNTLSGVEVRGGANPSFTNCNIINGRGYGVYARNNGHGIFQNNTVTGNASGAWLIEEGAGTVQRSGNDPNE